MTSTRALPVPHLELPTSEDIMEFSSELDRRPGIDEDIDIDFDFANEQLQDQDNDYIIEDARSEAGTGRKIFRLKRAMMMLCWMRRAAQRKCMMTL
jgi:hypothetical protein